MYLRAIELQGFKSFPDKVKLNFGRGMTAVVGPNGSGKSNLSDAVRWVLGEQSTKTLRGAKMEDVIFSGTKHRRPTGFAQVSLHIDNSDRALPVENDLCTVTRKLYRSGESDYLINGEPVRLKDVRELFMDTGLGRDGYSVIGQGKIAEIVSARDTERREIFEEAAGISKFRYRKEEALRRLEAAQENLNRLQDILGELESRVDPLREQARKANRYLELEREKRGVEISLWLTRFEGFAGQLRQLDHQFTLGRQEYQQAQQELQQLQNQMEQAFAQASQCAVHIQEHQARQAALEGELGENTSRQAVCRANMEHNRKALEELEQSLSQQQDAARKLEEQRDILRRQFLQRESREAQAQAQVQAAQAGLVDLRRQGEELAQALARAQEDYRAGVQQIADEKLGAATAQSAMAEWNARIQALEQELEHRGLVMEDTARELEASRALVQAAGEKAREWENICAGYEKKIGARRQKWEEEKAQGDKLLFALGEREQKIRILREMEQSLEGFSPSVKTVMQFARAGVLHGVVGPVSGLVQVPQAYTTAIETALGFAAQNIVVEQERSARDAIRILRERNGGRATFLPLDTLQPRQIREGDLEDNEGFVGIASHLVKTQDRYRVVAEFLLGNILVAQDLSCASRISARYRRRYRVVTLDGQVINPGGSYTGGSRVSSGGFFTRSNQISQLESEARQLRDRYEQGKPRQEALEGEIHALQSQLEGAKGRLEQAGRDQTEARVRAGGLESALKEQENQLASLEKERQGARERREALEQLSQRSGSRMEEALEQEKNAAANLALAQQREEAHQAKARQADQTLQQLRLELVSLTKDRESAGEMLQALEARLADAGEDRQRQEQRKVQLRQETGALEEELEQAVQNRRALLGEQEELSGKIRELTARRTQLEGESTQLRQEERVKNGLKEQVSRTLAGLEEKKATAQREYDALVAKLWDEYEITRSEAAKEYQPLEDSPENQNRLLRLRQEIKGLGNVNLEAIEEYRQVKERYDFLRGQTRDASLAKEELEKLIGDLTRSMVTLFTQGFGQISGYFTRIFRELFGGGTASLRLTDPTHVLESGIEIQVEPPGKIIRNLSLLSGGEQALVAIALYFAILKYRPSPFCVLDEIEAALDDVNVAKFASYVKQAGEQVQFIVITHRRGTMEAADVLYGVTMQEEGVSKLLQIDVAQAEQEILQQKA